MSFDQEARRSLDSLADRLRGEIDHELESVVAGFAASIETERAAAAAEAVAAARAETEQAMADVRSEAARAVADARSAAAQAVADVRNETARAVADLRSQAEQATRAALRTSELAASERLAEAIRGMDRARSLSEILDTLASCAGREAARVGVLLVREDGLRSWRFSGFGPALDESASFALLVSDAGILAEAVRTASTVSSDSAVAATAPAFAELPPGREMLAIPIPMGGQVIAVLYADQGIHEPADADLRVTWPATLEVMARHAARCLEAVTAFRAAQVLTERRDMSLPVSGAPDNDVRAVDGSREDELAARRYARLLISEIRLYHEADVIAGRQARDLTTRLGGEIARARALYDQRVPQARLADHFQEELIRTLAAGDASLLAVQT